MHEIMIFLSLSRTCIYNTEYVIRLCVCRCFFSVLVRLVNCACDSRLFTTQHSAQHTALVWIIHKIGLFEQLNRLPVQLISFSPFLCWICMYACMHDASWIVNIIVFECIGHYYCYCNTTLFFPHFQGVAFCRLSNTTVAVWCRCKCKLRMVFFSSFSIPCCV